MNFIRNNVFITLILLVFFTSCKREREVDDESQTTTDYSYCKMGFGTIITTTNNITVNEEGVRQLDIYSCASVTLFSGDTTNWPANGDTLKYEVNFGNGCIDHDGRIKKGKLWVSYVSDYANAGGQVKVLPDGFFVNGIEYQGEFTLTNNGNHQYLQTISNGKCIGNDWTVLYDGNTSIEWLNGFDTPADPFDDVYQVSENSTGTNRNSRSFTVETITPIIKKSDCKWISSGIIDITPSGLATRRIDFGSTDCDSLATITINGNTFNFEMQ